MSVTGDDIRFHAEPGRLCSMEFTVPAEDAGRFPLGLEIAISFDDKTWPMVVEEVWLVGASRAAVRLTRPHGFSPCTILERDNVLGALTELREAARPFGEMAQEMLTGHPTGHLPKGAPERLLEALSSAPAPVGRPDRAEMRDLAGLVLERTSQDSGPADCEPWTGWCVDLARDVLTLLDEAEQ